MTIIRIRRMRIVTETQLFPLTLCVEREQVVENSKVAAPLALQSEKSRRKNKEKI